MRIVELSDRCLVIEFAEHEFDEFPRELGVELPGRTWRFPGRLVGECFCVRADEMLVSVGADGAFTADGLDDVQRLVVADVVCSLWPWVCDSCDVRFLGEDGELWCCGGRHLKIVVRAPRSSAVLWTALTLLVIACEIALSFVMGIFEGVYGVAFINVLIAPSSLFCAMRTLRSWRFRVAANLRGLVVRPTVGREYTIPFSEVTQVVRTVGDGSAGTLRRLKICAGDRCVTVREEHEGIGWLDALLASRHV